MSNQFQTMLGMNKGGMDLCVAIVEIKGVFLMKK